MLFKFAVPLIVGAVVVSIAPAVARGPQPMESVPRWGLFEISVSNPRDYANPFAGVNLEATFISPSGKKVKASGFYDGEKTWRLRFMPDEIGAWRYETKFSDGLPGKADSLMCVNGNLRGPLRVNPTNRLWFQHADGTPVYILAFHLWSLDAMDEVVLGRTLDILATRGFNAIVGPHLTPRNGRLPWDKGADGKPDFSRFNLAEWRRLDNVARIVGQRKMVLIPFSIFGGTNGMPKIPTGEQEDLFLRYWTARWGGYWNITYQPTSEWEEAFAEADAMRIGAKIRELDEGRHLVSIHPLKAGTDKVQQANWYDYHTVQDKLTKWDPEKFTWLVGLYRRVPKPILAHENLWEGNLYHKEAGLDVDNMRKGSWVIALSGGQINYADEVLPGRKYQTRGSGDDYYSEKGAAMQPGGELYGALTILGKFMRSLPFERMTVAPELSGTGICLTQPGREYVTYAQNGGKITLDLNKAKGPFTGRWFNPRDGKFGKRFEVKGGKLVEFAPPDGKDWVLRLKK